MADNFIARLAQATFVPGSLEGSAPLLGPNVPWFAYCRNKGIRRVTEDKFTVEVALGITSVIGTAYPVVPGRVVMVEPSLRLESFLSKNLKSPEAHLVATWSVYGDNYTARAYSVRVEDALEFWQYLYYKYEKPRS